MLLPKELRTILINIKDNTDTFVISYTSGFKQAYIDELINSGYLEKINETASSSAGFGYIVKLTYKGIHYKRYEIAKILNYFIGCSKFWIPLILSIVSLILQIKK